MEGRFLKCRLKTDGVFVTEHDEDRRVQSQTHLQFSVVSDLAPPAAPGGNSSGILIITDQ